MQAAVQWLPACLSSHYLAADNFSVIISQYYKDYLFQEQRFILSLSWRQFVRVHYYATD
jgi:hypothetical protein